MTRRYGVVTARIRVVFEARERAKLDELGDWEPHWDRRP
jgi:hypothetical protein